MMLRAGNHDGLSLIIRRKAMSLRWRTATLGLILATATLSIVSLSAQTSDPLAGTWELNLGKSKFSPGPPPKSETRTYDVTGQQEKMIAKGMDAEGKPTLIQFTATRDGKDYPYTGSPIIDTVSLTPVDTFTLTFVTKKDGKVALTGTRVISNDGKMMTLSSKGTNPKGQPVENTAVYEKR
jgi:hypothetical protein